MDKIKVGVLAEELKITPKELLVILKDLGVSAKTAASAIDGESAKLVKDLIKGAGKPKQATIEKPEAKAAVQPQTAAPEVAPAPAAVKNEKIIVFEAGEVQVKDLAEKIKIKPSELIKELMKKGKLVNINQKVDIAFGRAVAEELGFTVEVKIKTDDKDLRMPELVDRGNLVPRPPIVTILGHVDHGKTKLLDAIRSSNVVDSESGGITQHIGAYQVDIKGKKITFLDTPGHEAFTALRARGAKVTDIAILVIAADDGVKPQTIEALDHAKAAQVPIIVALNKVDKPEANLDRVKQQMTELELTPEEWGGKTVTVPVSAKQKKGIDELLEMILLVAEMQELRADPKAKASGVVVESELDKTKGPLATVLVRNGTLKVGDVVSVGVTCGKVRALINDHGKRINEAPPSTPIEILGLEELPMPGDLLRVVKDEKEARNLAGQHKEIQDKVFKGRLRSLEDYSKQMKEGEVKDLNLILKVDVQGSLEAILGSLRNLSSSRARINLVHSGVGGINESDIMLAAASESIVVGFRVGYEGNAQALVQQEGINVRQYEIIYKLTEDLQLALEGLLEPEYEEVIVGHADVRNLFRYSKVGVIAGCFVVDGKLIRGRGLRIFRDNKKIYEGKLESLKRFKDDVKEVAENFECGVAIVGYEDFKEKDRLECFEMRPKARG